jgi:hypothetical protein
VSLPTGEHARQTFLVSSPAFSVCAVGRDLLDVLSRELGYRFRVALVLRGNPFID